MADIWRWLTSTEIFRQEAFAYRRLCIEFVEQIDIALPNQGCGGIDAGFVRPSLQHIQQILQFISEFGELYIFVLDSHSD